MQTGTHGIADATLDQTEFGVTTTYFQRSSERGALVFFINEGKDEVVDFTRSAIIALDKASSLSYTLPFELYAGKYRMLIYDIEQDGTLLSGVGYPAISTDEITTRSDSQGM